MPLAQSSREARNRRRDPDRDPPAHLRVIVVASMSGKDQYRPPKSYSPFPLTVQLLDVAEELRMIHYTL